MRRRFLTAGDGVIIAAMLVLAAVLFAFGADGNGGSRHVVVEVAGTPALELPLDSNVTRTVRGARGETVVVIEAGTVRIAGSACPAHTCVRMGPISHPGEIIVCVPNQVLVTIRGGAGPSFDGVTR